MRTRSTAPDLFDLTGRVAVVTGSTKGLGRAIAQGLAEAGASVVVSSRKQELCVQVAAEIAGATGRDTLGAACHVGDWDAIDGFVEVVVERFGGIDILVNNAGISPPDPGLEALDLALWRKVYAVNVEGPLRMMQRVVPHMRARGGGAIVNVSTVGAFAPGPQPYVSAKAALLSLNKTAASEFAPDNIRVNAVCPGPLLSEMTRGAERYAPGSLERMASVNMQQRVGGTHEIVGPVLYLVSDAASFVTGEEHIVGGGMRRG